MKIPHPALPGLALSLLLSAGCTDTEPDARADAGAHDKDASHAGDASHGDAGDLGPSLAMATSKLTREQAPAVTSASKDQLGADNRAFALDLYQQLRGEKGNLFVSPYSISSA